MRFDAFQDLTPGAPRIEEKLRRVGPTMCSATCVAVLSGLHGELYMSTDVEMFIDEVKARAQYEAFRAVTFGDHKDATDVAGVGDAAHFYTDPTLGPTLVVSHGVVNLEVSVTALRQVAAIPADARDRLTKLAVQTLAGLRGP